MISDRELTQGTVRLGLDGELVLEAPARPEYFPDREAAELALASWRLRDGS